MTILHLEAHPVSGITIIDPIDFLEVDWIEPKDFIEQLDTLDTPVYSAVTKNDDNYDLLIEEYGIND